MADPFGVTCYVFRMAAVESTTDLSAQELVRAVDALVDECRVESLWSFRPDYYPRTDLERLQVLDAIQERSGREVFRRAGNLKTWLSRHSKDESASS